MSVSTVVTLGYGAFGSVNRVPTLGYGGAALVRGPLRFCAGTVFVPGMQKGRAYLPGAQQAAVYQPGMQAGEVGT